MLCRDCGFRRAGPLGVCGRCAGKALAPAPRIIASGKTCPKCGEITYLSRAVCAGCGHTYRTAFPSRQSLPPDVGGLPYPTSPEASASGAGRVFRFACALLIALSALLIFFFVNHY